MWIECNGSIYVKKGDIFYNSHRFLFMFLVNKYKIQQTNLAQVNYYSIFAWNNFQKIYEWWETIKQKKFICKYYTNCLYNFFVFILNKKKIIENPYNDAISKK